MTAKKRKAAAKPFYEELSSQYPVRLSAQEFAQKIFSEAVRRCDAQIERARAGERRKAAIYVDMMRSDICTTLWEDKKLRRDLEALVRHAALEIASLPPPATAAPAPDATAEPPRKKSSAPATGHPISISPDGRIVRQGQKVLSKLTQDEAMWISCCMDRYEKDGTDEFDLAEVSRAAFGASTRRTEPSRIFRRSGTRLFSKLFEKTDTPGVYAKREHVVFESREDA